MGWLCTLDCGDLDTPLLRGRASLLHCACLNALARKLSRIFGRGNVSSLPANRNL